MSVMIDLYLSTIGEGAAALARRYGFGLEISDFSYAANMDTDFPHWDAVTRENLTGVKSSIFHAPYSELNPAAFDPLVAEVTRRRLEQAFLLTRRYHINRMVVHSGFVPRIYHKSWFVERSVEFWRDFLDGKPPDFSLLLENVMEDSPDMLMEIVDKTGDRRLRLCLDVGHAGGYFSGTPVLSWVETAAPYLSHAHIHNNNYEEDLHDPPGKGVIDVEAVMLRIVELCPGATFTAETADLTSAVSWLEQRGFLGNAGV